ncbi:Uncharacterized protein QJS10_CPB04g01314 [Acorus calamus]|uniref:Small ribosomal subunit protein bS18c n=1 Tax=Acorus calamus TaxID=4465 RepID=A0AAV9EY20_ACOCL|nr:Uncharacterized protein QJS10_CPB04g01314 [Acorus calamus]
MEKDKNKGKGKGNTDTAGMYSQWNQDESEELLALLVDACGRGWRDASGSLPKQLVEARILSRLNSKLGCKKTFTQYQSRNKYFKRRFVQFEDLMRHSSGFGWDPNTKKFTADPEVWEEFFKNVRFLANFITKSGIIIKRRKTGISAKAQRKVAREIKTARAFGLMPFTTMGMKTFIFGKMMEDTEENYEFDKSGLSLMQRKHHFES